MKKVGFDPDEVKGMVTIMDLGKLRTEMGEDALSMGFTVEDGKKISWMKSLLTQIKNYQQMQRFKILVIDSLDALCVLSAMSNPRNEMFHFFEGLRGLGLTTLVVSEIHGEHKTFGKYGVESFLSDGIIHLAMEREKRTVGRYISVVKMRATKHATDYFPLLLSNRGFEIIAK